MNDYLFFKGCTIPVKFPYLEKLALALLPSIGINLDESTQFSCCPDPIQVTRSQSDFLVCYRRTKYCDCRRTR